MSQVPLHVQKLAALRAHQILTEHYPARFQGKATTEAGKQSLLSALDAVMDTLDRLDRGEDVRPDLLPERLGASQS
jgi:hypothetical protein